MPYEINETHDPNLKSWVESANDPSSDFPIQNLPIFAGFHPRCIAGDGPQHGTQLYVAIGDYGLNLDHFDECYCLEEDDPVYKYVDGLDVDLDIHGIGGQRLNDFASRRNSGRLRKRLVELFRVDTRRVRDKKDFARRFLFPRSEIMIAPPASIENYTDFYASVHHATTVGAMFRPDNPLLPNYKHVPIGYHGRASSIVLSGTEIRRPNGQQSPPDDNVGAGPSFGPCKLLDYELELGFFVGPGNELGKPISVSEAEDHIFGVCLVNDWSARDVQKWEYQPLGPFLAKNFATSISPYVVTMEALAPFRAPAYARPAGDPRPLPYLWNERDQKQGGLDITLEVYLASKQMRDRGMSPIRLSKGSTRDLYWTPAQMLAHHTSNGCNMQAGDLFASGTVSGPTPDSRGCLLELTWDGQGKPRKAIELPTGEKRTFLADGDEVIFKGYCEREGFRRIGLGECRGVITPAVSPV